LFFCIAVTLRGSSGKDAIDDQFHFHAGPPARTVRTAADSDRDPGHDARLWAALLTAPCSLIIDPTEAGTQT